MRPALGSRNLVSRLNTVVLPAPFGPISAWIVPRRTCRSTPRTAAKPRNSFVRPRVSRMTSDKLFYLGSVCSDHACLRGGATLCGGGDTDKNLYGYLWFEEKAVSDAIERALDEIKFGPDGLGPAIAQQHDTREVLMMAWMNRDAVRMTLGEGRVC